VNKATKVNEDFAAFRDHKANKAHKEPKGRKGAEVYVESQELRVSKGPRESQEYRG